MHFRFRCYRIPEMTEAASAGLGPERPEPPQPGPSPTSPQPMPLTDGRPRRGAACAASASSSGLTPANGDWPRLLRNDLRIAARSAGRGNDAVPGAPTGRIGSSAWRERGRHRALRLGRRSVAGCRWERMPGLYLCRCGRRRRRGDSVGRGGTGLAVNSAD